jgi:acyl carrier protein/1-acyl-sn-glycerol-3-phosphate acyltransferase
VHPREWLASQLERRTGVPRAEVDAHRPLAQYGLGSIGVAELISAAEEHFGAHIPWSRLLEAPTLASLAAAVSRSDDDAKRAPAAEAPRPSPGVFIPARENRLVLAAARLGVRRLFRKHFHAVWLRRGYTPADRTTRTVYVLNHTSWWDFCIPFLLDDRLFRQRARYMMSHDVMSARWHARLLLPRAGVFSIRLDDEALRVASLRYAADFMRVEGRSFYLYPQGKIHPESDEIRFQDGVGWLHARLPGADFVPVACHLHTLRTARPQLYLSVGEGVQIDARVGIGERTRVLEASCRDLVRDLRALAHDATRLDRDKGFERLR